MKHKSKIDKVENCIVTLRNGSKWKIDKYDEFTVKGWSFMDEIESETIGLDKGLHNLKRNKKIKADPL